MEFPFLWEGSALKNGPLKLQSMDYSIRTSLEFFGNLDKSMCLMTMIFCRISSDLNLYRCENMLEKSWELSDEMPNEMQGLNKPFSDEEQYIRT